MTTKLNERKISGGIPAAALGSSAPPPAAPAPAAPRTKLSALRAQVARGEHAELPGIGRVFVQLVGSAKRGEIEGAVLTHMEKIGVPFLPIHAFSYDQDRKRRTLAEAVRDPDDPSQPFGTYEDWCKEDDDIIYAAGLVYQDVQARLDPIGVGELDADTESLLLDAFKKKDWSRLQSFGVALLARWLTTGAVQLSSSPTPASSSGPPSQE